MPLSIISFSYRSTALTSSHLISACNIPCKQSRTKKKKEEKKKGDQKEDLKIK